MTFMVGFVSGLVVGMALIGICAWALWPQDSDDYAQGEHL